MKSSVVFSAYRLAVRFNYIFSAIDLPKLLTSLTLNGYIITQPISVPALIHPYQVNFSGIIANKDGASVDLNTEKNSLGVQHNSLEVVIDRFNEICSIIDSDTHDTTTSVWFYEFQGNVRYNRNEKEFFNVAGKEVDRIVEYSSSLGENISVRGIKFGSKGTDPSSPNYFEINIEPYLTNKKELSLIYVYRHKKRGRVLDFAKKVMNTGDNFVNSLLHE